MKAIFLDRDGTVNVGIPKYERIDRVDKVELLPRTLDGLRLLATLDFGVFFVTNQAGLAEGLITEAEFTRINERVLELIAPSGITILRSYVCPHGVDEGCACRKPQPKLLLDAAADYAIDLQLSYMIGDRLSDVQTGINAGTKSILVRTGDPTVTAPTATYTAADLLEAVRYIVSR
jgi:D-glycero-D-manno-heptose 1,7-bisphosphate phosphatase